MMSPEDALTSVARDIYEGISDLPIVSPHGHCDPAWWATDAPFPDPASLLIVPDHYVFRMLYSQGVALEDLGIGVPITERDPRAIFQKFADHWHCFLGTPSREWLEFTLYRTLGVSVELAPETASQVFDEVTERLADRAFRPRALFDHFNIEILATTDAAVDTLDHHQAIQRSDWTGKIVPTFRPDNVLNPERQDFASAVQTLREICDSDLGSYQSYLDAIRQRRAFFKSLGATATDHDVPYLAASPLSTATASELY